MEETHAKQYKQSSFKADGPQIQNHPLTQVETREEGGVTAEFKAGYQKELATLACISMLFPENNIKSIAVELHEDYVIEYTNDCFDFRQVKHKDEGEMASFGTLSDALHNLYLQFKKFRNAANKFTLECNLSAHSHNKGNLFELKNLLAKSRKVGLDPVDEDRLSIIKTTIVQLEAFKEEDQESVRAFVDQLNISSNMNDVDAIREKSKSKIGDYLCRQNRTTHLDTKARDDLYDKIYLLVDRASRERDDKNKRIIYRDAVKQIIPSASNFAELSNPILEDQEYHLLTDIDPEHTILQSKCSEANLDEVIEILIDAKILARNRNDHYRANTLALNYINYLRVSINRRHQDEKLKARTNNRQHDHPQLYLDVMNNLQAFARDERQNDVSVRVDFEYLRGLYAQLVSECPITP